MQPLIIYLTLREDEERRWFYTYAYVVGKENKGGGYLLAPGDATSADHAHVSAALETIWRVWAAAQLSGRDAPKGMEIHCDYARFSGLATLPTGLPQSALDNISRSQKLQEERGMYVRWRAKSVRVNRHDGVVLRQTLDEAMKEALAQEAEGHGEGTSHE